MGRYALIVANDAYQDSGLRELRAPRQDADQLAGVLGDPDIGGFSVRTLHNESAADTNEAIEDFFADRAPDDLLLLYFSGHGVKDESGDLYFATTGTKLNRLGATAVAANFVRRLMGRTRARRVVLLLDCCYAGAFGRGMVARAGTSMALEEQFQGRGRAVITASSAMEYAFEGQELTDTAAGAPSVFTSALVEGLRTGDADRDQDGRVGLDELYEYVYDKVRAATPNQTPGKWVFDLQGDLYIARRGRPVSVPSELPLELREAVLHPNRSVRAAAVDDLARLLTGGHEGLALAAHLALDSLVEDDSRTVAAAATQALAAVQPEAPAAGSTAPPLDHEPPPEPANDDTAQEEWVLKGPEATREPVDRIVWRVIGAVLAAAAAVVLAMIPGDIDQLAPVLTQVTSPLSFSFIVVGPVAIWLLAGTLVGLIAVREERAQELLLGTGFAFAAVIIAFTTRFAVVDPTLPGRVLTYGLFGALVALLVYSGMHGPAWYWVLAAGVGGVLTLLMLYRSDSWDDLLPGAAILIAVATSDLIVRARDREPVFRTAAFQLLLITNACVSFTQETNDWPVYAVAATVALAAQPLLNGRLAVRTARVGAVAATLLLIQPPLFSREVTLSIVHIAIAVAAAVVALWPERVRG
ncbi:phosphate starvation-inducible membrane PsiE [Actinokineospora baliensis]|uniref:caspase family protein n=1 Tax=Actinokineospora baliensis TaxID=547056 RepID=UPI00195C4175|nr:caspase family protein [Actinokineospora baliensis]MBM7773382.1 phosphate starvation-inducible membrane PsiE [Actinokineospora baliensis]